MKHVYLTLEQHYKWIPYHICQYNLFWIFYSRMIFVIDPSPYPWDEIWYYLCRIFYSNSKFLSLRRIFYSRTILYLSWIPFHIHQMRFGTFCKEYFISIARFCLCVCYFILERYLIPSHVHASLVPVVLVPGPLWVFVLGSDEPFLYIYIYICAWMGEYWMNPVFDIVQ